ncbi:MAG TPA: divalent metal cation transporter [Ktedonobacterales bacterium]|jgi:Mn2+/Fe2+ NRAMP family transporter
MRQPPHLLADAQRMARGLRARLTQSARGRPRPLPGLRRVLRILGPGLVTGAADDDPSGIGTYSQAGAAFGVGQLWLALYMLPMLIAVQEMCARIGLVTGRGIAANLRAHYSRPILYFTVALVFAANTLNIGADLGAMTATIQLFAPGAPFLPLLVALALAILALEIFVPYHRYAIVLKILALSLLAYVATGLIVGTHGASPLRETLIPSIQLTPEFLALVVGVLGTTISPYLFFWQASEEVEEGELHPLRARPSGPIHQQWLTLAQIHALRLDTIIGMVSSEIATWFIIFTTGSVLHPHGVTNITTASQAASALEPLVHSFPYAGELARIIFAVGILGVGLLGIPVLAGSAAYAVAEAFHWNEGLARTFRQAPGFYVVMGAAIVLGVLLNLLHINPIAALVYSAIINGVVAVPLLILITLVANNKAIMRSFTNGRLSNVVVILTTIAMGVAAIALMILSLAR